MRSTRSRCERRLRPLMGLSAAPVPAAAAGARAAGGIGDAAGTGSVAATPRAQKSPVLLQTAV